MFSILKCKEFAKSERVDNYEKESSLLKTLQEKEKMQETKISPFLNLYSTLSKATFVILATFKLSFANNLI